jgi:hypothetical protein
MKIGIAYRSIVLASLGTPRPNFGANLVAGRCPDQSPLPLASGISLGVKRVYFG